jgi:hypothetical protein
MLPEERLMRPRRPWLAPGTGPGLPAGGIRIPPVGPPERFWRRRSQGSRPGSRRHLGAPGGDLPRKGSALLRRQRRGISCCFCIIALARCQAPTEPIEPCREASLLARFSIPVG